MKHFLFFILIFAIFLGFIVLNLENKCDVSLGFTTFADIPIFVSALFAFALGILFMLPLTLSVGLARRKKAEKVKAESMQIEAPRTDDARLSGPKPSLREKLFSRKSPKKNGESSGQDKSAKEAGPYGID